MDEPKIEFPCDYPVKVIVEIAPDVVKDILVEEIISIIEHHDPKLSRESISYNPSRNGKYTSIRFIIWATGTPQLEMMFTELKQCEAVRMVL
ncbi:MAG: putative lipoic acid-binding regulatory protein [Candidatus Azotimanducaceae bacterium]|jgi:putative lipoic acid-binding regulatory protein